MKVMWAAKHYKKIQAVETAGLEVKYIYVDKEFIIEAIIFCLKNGLWLIFSLLTFILI